MLTGEGSVKLAVACFTGANLEVIQPLKVTDSHVVIKVKGLFHFGLLKNMIFPTKPINAQVLLLDKIIPDIQRQIYLKKMYIFLLPGNVPVEEVMCFMSLLYCSTK